MTTLEKIQARAKLHTEKLQKFRDELPTHPKTHPRYYQLSAYIQVLTGEVDFLNLISSELGITEEFGGEYENDEFNS
jgi:hypothetical protein